MGKRDARKDAEDLIKSYKGVDAFIYLTRIVDMMREDIQYFPYMDKPSDRREALDDIRRDQCMLKFAMDNLPDISEYLKNNEKELVKDVDDWHKDAIRKGILTE